MISGLTKSYYVTSSMQKTSPIHQFIFEIKQLLESQDLKGHSHIWPCAYPAFEIFLGTQQLPRLLPRQICIFFNVHCIGKLLLRQSFNGLVVKALDSQSRGLVFKTTGWLQGQLSLSSFPGQWVLEISGNWMVKSKSGCSLEAFFFLAFFFKVFS